MEIILAFFSSEVEEGHRVIEVVGPGVHTFCVKFLLAGHPAGRFHVLN